MNQFIAANEEQEEQKSGFIEIETEDKGKILMHKTIHKAYFQDRDHRKLSLSKAHAVYLLRLLYGELIDVQVWQWTK